MDVGSMEAGGWLVVVLDFDKTIIEVDSDDWVAEDLGFNDLFERLLPTMPLNSVMETMVREMQEEGVTTEDIAKVLRRIPIHPRVIPAIKSAYVAGCELRIVSDSNEFFIETVLDHLGVRGCFSVIHTNPGRVDEQGRLRIGPHQGDSNNHGCANPCPRNLCKGQVMERMLAELHSTGSSRRIIYLGDGLGDYCPALKLRSCDFVMPRKDFPAHGLIHASADIKAQVHLWSDGAQLESVLLALIACNLNAATTAAPFLYADCSFPAPLFNPLPLPH